MRALQIDAFGDLPTLRDVAMPRPGLAEIGVRISACGLNFADTLLVEGRYQDLPALPATLGMELAGVIESCGASVSGLAPGDRVAVYAGSGGLAEYGAFAADRAVRIPETMSDLEAAGFLVAYGTSHLGLTHRARLEPGETLLVLGAAGGVGRTAVEVGKAMGARVIAQVSGAQKGRVAADAGADHVLDVAADGLRDAVRELGGADVVYDPVGGDAFRAALRATNPDGRILVVGFASGEVPQIPANHLLVKNISVLGYWWGGYRSFAPARVTDSLATLFDWHAAGRLRPYVGTVLPLERAAEGLDLLRSRKARGKIVVTTAG